MPASTELNDLNKSAWDSLYASTDEAVWGHAPVGFLRATLPSSHDLPVAGRVLDAAAGEGRNLGLLQSLGRPVVACDASAAALTKIPAPLSARVEKFACDLASIPVPDADFAFVLLSDVFETLPEPEKVLRELRRVLVPGGLMLANIPDDDDGIAGVKMNPVGAGWLYDQKYYFRFYKPAEVDRMFAQVGFELIRAETREWEEAAHPQFRPEVHRHRSRILLARRPLEA